MRLTTKLFTSGLALTLSLGLAVLAAPVDVDPVPSKYHLEFDRSPDLEWALERRGKESTKKLSTIPETPVSQTIIVTMLAPPQAPEEKSEAVATENDINEIVENVKELFGLASHELGVAKDVQVQVHSKGVFTHVPKLGVQLLFTAELPGGLKSVCKGKCRGALMAGSKKGKIYGNDGKVVYESEHFGSI